MTPQQQLEQIYQALENHGRNMLMLLQQLDSEEQQAALWAEMDAYEAQLKAAEQLLPRLSGLTPTLGTLADRVREQDRAIMQALLLARDRLAERLQVLGRSQQRIHEVERALGSDHQKGGQVDILS